MMTRGMEMMIKSLIGMLGLNPQIIEGHIVGMGKSLHNAASRLEAIERQNALIMARLGIETHTGDTNDVQSEQSERKQLNGPVAGTA